MESKMHMNLVSVAMDYIQSIIPKEKHSLIQYDSTGEISCIRLIGGYIPDIYYNFQGLMVIGEAKTADDFSREHSKLQFEAYFNECKIYKGETILVIVVPWNIVPAAKNYFRRIRNKMELEENNHIFVLNELGGCFEI